MEEWLGLTDPEAVLRYANCYILEHDSPTVAPGFWTGIRFIPADRVHLTATPPVKGLVAAVRQLLAKVDLEPGAGKPIARPVLIGDLVILADALADLEAK